MTHGYLSRNYDSAHVCTQAHAEGSPPFLWSWLILAPTATQQTPHDHFKNHFLLLNFANNLLSVLADVSVFNPLGTGWTCFLPHVKNKRNGPNVAPYPREAPLPHSLTLSHLCDFPIPSQISSFPLEDVSNYGPLYCQG